MVAGGITSILFKPQWITPRPRQPGLFTCMIADGLQDPLHAWFSSRNCLTFFWYPPPPPLFCEGVPPFGAGKLLCQRNSRSTREAVNRLSINHARSNQTCCRVYTSMFVCVQERTGDGRRWRDIAGGAYADCSACNPPWYLIDL